MFILHLVLWVLNIKVLGMYTHTYIHTHRYGWYMWIHTDEIFTRNWQCDCGRWLSESEIWRAGSQNGKMTTQAGWNSQAWTKALSTGGQEGASQAGWFHGQGWNLMSTEAMSSLSGEASVLLSKTFNWFSQAHPHYPE